jgi:hypothetical protein
LIAASDRGVDVQVVVDWSNESHRGGITDGLMAADIQVWVDWSPAIAHSKVMIVDHHHLVVGGSFNDSAVADSRNAENGTFPRLAGTNDRTADRARDANLRQVGIRSRIAPETFVLMVDEGPDGDASAAAVTE